MILVPGDLFYALMAVQFTDGLTKLVHETVVSRVRSGTLERIFLNYSSLWNPDSIDFKVS